MNNNQPIPIQSGPIGILDSGVGGLSIWRDIISELPQEQIIYLADSANCPYGPRSTEEVYALARRLVQFLLAQHVKMIVIACNTITVSCIDTLRQEFPQVPIIGTVPVVKTAAERVQAGKTKTQAFGILSTTRTAQSVYQQTLIDQFAAGIDVISVGTDQLVPFIEKGDVVSESFKSVLEEVLQPFQEKHIDTIALACTHYPFARGAMQEILGNEVMFLDPGPAIARHARRILTNNHILRNEPAEQHYFYTTGDKAQFQKTVQMLLGYNVGEGVQIAHVDL